MKLALRSTYIFSLAKVVGMSEGLDRGQNIFTRDREGRILQVTVTTIFQNSLVIFRLNYVFSTLKYYIFYLTSFLKKN